MRNLDNLLSQCGGIKTITESKSRYSGGGYASTTESYYLVGDIVVPDDVYIEITSTSTKGTIGKLVDLEIGGSDIDNRIYSWGITYIIQIEGRNGTNRIICTHAKILEVFNGPTKWVRNVKKHIKKIIPPHVNKYKQSLNMDDWVAGIGPGKILYFGKVTRWTKSSVWVNPTPSILESKESCINRPKETIVLPPGIEYEQIVTMMALKGWRR